MSDYNNEKYPVGALKPKAETGVLNFLAVSISCDVVLRNLTEWFFRNIQITMEVTSQWLSWTQELILMQLDLWFVWNKILIKLKFIQFFLIYSESSKRLS